MKVDGRTIANALVIALAIISFVWLFPKVIGVESPVIGTLFDGGNRKTNPVASEPRQPIIIRNAANDRGVSRGSDHEVKRHRDTKHHELSYDHGRHHRNAGTQSPPNPPPPGIERVSPPIRQNPRPVLNHPLKQIPKPIPHPLKQIPQTPPPAIPHSPLQIPPTIPPVCL